MRIALFGKAVSPDDAEALRLALDRVLAIDPQAWISRAYMGELSDHMQIPAGLVPYEGAVPAGWTCCSPLAETGRCWKQARWSGTAPCPSWG